jgi:3-oxoacyl-[acyl-carrier-protein] synthase III
MQKLTAKEKREYIRGHYQVQTVEQLAEHLGITRQGVLYYLRKMGVKSSPLRPYRLDKHVQAEVCRMGGKVSDKALGAQLGVPFSVVKYYRQKYGIGAYVRAHPGSGK